MSPGLAESRLGSWRGAEGLAADIRAYGAWMCERAQERIGHLYPDVDGKNVVAWIWARTVMCPNPACGIEMPLVRSWWLSKKAAKEAYVVAFLVADHEHPSGQRVAFRVSYEKSDRPTSTSDGTMARGRGTCVACGGIAPGDYIRAQAKTVGLGSQLMAVVAEGQRQRLYLTPPASHSKAAEVERPPDVPEQLVPSPNHDVDRLPMYGMARWSDAFTNRQLTGLATLSDLVAEAREQVLMDGGTPAYADAVATYLGLAVSLNTDYSSSICSWHSGRDTARNVFARQAIPMVWDFVESNLLSGVSGSFASQVAWIASVIEALVPRAGADAIQADAATRNYSGMVLSTDPPYYDNIGYSDLSDFFYVWLRRSLRTVHPDLLATMLVPKAEELVANPNRHDGKAGAKASSRRASVRLRACPRECAPAFRSLSITRTSNRILARTGEASSGWETLLEGMIRSRLADHFHLANAQ